MTVIYTHHGALQPGNKPDWCQTPAAEYFRMPKEGGKHDCHYHDYNELYLVCGGKAKILNDGEENYAKPTILYALRQVMNMTFWKFMARRTSNRSGYMSLEQRVDDWDICIAARNRNKDTLFLQGQFPWIFPPEESAATHNKNSSFLVL